MLTSYGFLKRETANRIQLIIESADARLMYANIKVLEVREDQVARVPRSREALRRHSSFCGRFCGRFCARFGRRFGSPLAIYLILSVNV
jgi:hypothetical protein